MMKRFVSSMMAALMILNPMSSFAAKDSEYKTALVAKKYYVTLSNVEVPFFGEDGETELPMTKDDKWYQKRIPLIDDEMDTGLGYRIHADAKFARKKAVTWVDSVGNMPSYIDTIDAPNYTATFRFYTFAEKPYQSLIEEVEKKYGTNGWSNYRINNTCYFSEKITKNSITIHGTTMNGTTTFVLHFVPKKGKKLQTWWGRNVVQGLEVFILKQQFRYVNSGHGSAYVSQMETTLVDPETLFPDEGEFSSNEYNPGGEQPYYLPVGEVGKANTESVWPSNPYYQASGLLDPKSIDIIGKDQPHYQNADPYTQWVMDNFNASFQNLYEYGTDPYSYAEFGPSMYYDMYFDAIQTPEYWMYRN